MKSQQLKTVAGLLVFVLVGIHGAHELIQWYSTGQLWANFRSRGEPNNYQLIMYGDHPFNFVGLFIVNAMFVVVGCLACIAFVRTLRMALSKNRTEG
jgi:hypothetical protein